jgi:hypothetical protein
MNAKRMPLSFEFKLLIFNSLSKDKTAERKDSEKDCIWIGTICLLPEGSIGFRPAPSPNEALIRNHKEKLWLENVKLLAHRLQFVTYSDPIDLQVFDY